MISIYYQNDEQIYTTIIIMLIELQGICREVKTTAIVSSSCPD
jgi:hypothetical protein